MELKCGDDHRRQSNVQTCNMFFVLTHPALYPALLHTLVHRATKTTAPVMTFNIEGWQAHAFLNPGDKCPEILDTGRKCGRDENWGSGHMHVSFLCTVSYPSQTGRNCDSPCDPDRKLCTVLCCAICSRFQSPGAILIAIIHFLRGVMCMSYSSVSGGVVFAISSIMKRDELRETVRLLAQSLFFWGWRGGGVILGHEYNPL